MLSSLLWWWWLATQYSLCPLRVDFPVYRCLYELLESEGTRRLRLELPRGLVFLELAHLLARRMLDSVSSLARFRPEDLPVRFDVPAQDVEPCYLPRALLPVVLHEGDIGRSGDPGHEVEVLDRRPGQEQASHAASGYPDLRSFSSEDLRPGVPVSDRRALLEWHRVRVWCAMPHHVEPRCDGGPARDQLCHGVRRRSEERRVGKECRSRWS